MLAILLALASAGSYGVGDFAGGVASRRQSPLATIAISQPVGGLLLLLAALTVVDGQVTTRGVLVGVLAGATGGVAVALFYRALSIGTMSVIAPVTAVLSALIPFTVGLAAGERPGLLAGGGGLVALLAIALVARTPGGGSVTGLLPAIGAGVGFGLFFVLLARVGDGAGLWPLVAGRAATTVAGLALVLALRQAPVRGALGASVLCGVLDASANAFYVLALERGLLSVVAVVVSLYPASTVLLARFLLQERLSRVQQVGLAAAAAAVALLATS